MSTRHLPYPPTPKDVPPDLTIASPRFMFHATMLLLSLFLFLIVYVGMIVLCGYLIYSVWTVDSTSMSLQGQIIIIPLVTGFLGLFMLFLIKGFFPRETSDRTNMLELKEEENPTFFDFIDELCKDTGAPFPNRIFVYDEVNACVISNLSMVNLFVSPTKDLALGLGLVNALNLSELKAVLAHELGHVAQKGFINSYSYVCSLVIANMVNGRDWLDDFLERTKEQQNAIAFLASLLYGMIFLTRRFLVVIYKGITFLNFLIAHQREFNADLVAASVSGSDAIVHGLKRSEFAYESLMQAQRELADAADHRLYSCDIFYHQTCAAEYLRKRKKNPNLGLPPVLNSPSAGKKIQVFSREEHGEAPMWDYHPSMYDREENVKSFYIPSKIDDRPAWVIFDDPVLLRERVSYQFYRQHYKVPKNIELDDKEKVQKFIDDEHAEMTYAPKYSGVYDGRFLNPGRIEELDESIQAEPWDAERLIRVEEKLYKGLEQRVEDYQDARKELDSLLKASNFRPQGKIKKKVRKIESELDEYGEWFASFDRRVYLVYMQMALALPDPSSYRELHDRYQFHLPLQKLNKKANDNRCKVETYVEMLFQSTKDTLTQDLLTEAMSEFRSARKTLRDILREACEMKMPMLKNFTGDESLDEFLLDEKLVKELPEDYVKLDWIRKLYDQINQVLNKSARLYYKSVGNILALQEKVCKEFRELKHDIIKSEADSAKADAVEANVKNTSSSEKG